MGRCVSKKKCRRLLLQCRCPQKRACCVNTERTFFPGAAKPACNSRRLQTALFVHRQTCKSVFLLTMADLLLEPAVLSSAPRKTRARTTLRTQTHADTLGLILRDVRAYLFTCTSLTHTHTHRSTVSTQRSLHFAHREVSVWAGPGRALLSLAGDFSPW